MKLEITANVAVRTVRVNGAARKLSTIFIKAGEEIIAERTIPAAWDKASALKEFRRFPDRFCPRGDRTKAQLCQLAQVA